MRQEIYRAFRKANALTPERARRLGELALADSEIFRSLCNRRVVREVSAGMYYLDEDAHREFQGLVLRWVAVPVIVFLALLIYLIAKG